MLQHVSRPVDALRGLWDRVGPGGVLAVEDADFAASFCEPPNAGFDLALRAYCEVLRRRGGDPLIGRHPYGHFLAAGIPDPQLNLVQRTDAAGDTKPLTLSTLEATAEAMVGEVASQQEVEAAHAELARATDDPATLIGLPRTFQVWARR